MKTQYDWRITFVRWSVLLLSTMTIAHSQQYSYAVVISSESYSQSEWKIVADSLAKKHSSRGKAHIFTWSASVTELKSSLSVFKPDYIGFIARPVTECNSSFIVTVSRLCRQLDSDPYGDAVWGVITGYDASDALRAISESLMVKTVLAASGNLSYEPPIRRFYQAIGMTCDSYTKTDYQFPEKLGKVYTENRRPENEQDRIKLVSKWLNTESLDIEISGQGKISGPVDCIITGGHGNVNLWQCHYPDAGTEGYMRSSGGKLFGAPYSGNSIDIHSPTPKIYWCASNCLMGNPDNRNNFVYAAFRTGHAVQMFGFVNNASSGNEFMAWGVYDRVTKSAGTYTLPQGFFLSNNNALFEIQNSGRQINTRLVEKFMDSTVFYGDPAADVKFQDLGDSAKVYKTELLNTSDGSGTISYTFTITMLAHDLEYGAGYCYQFRPISLLPVRIDPATAVVTRNDGHYAEITDNLVIWEMLSSGERLPKGSSRTLQWTAEVEDNTTGISSKKSIIHAPHLQILPLKGNYQITLYNLPSGPLSLKIIDLAGKQFCSGNFTSDGTAKQSFTIKKSISKGLNLIVLTQGMLVLNKLLIL